MRRNQIRPRRENGEKAYRQIENNLAVVLSGIPVKYERHLVTLDGVQRFIEVDLVPHFDEAQKMIGSFIVINDITKHRLAEQAVRDSEERVKKFAAASNDGILFLEDGILTDLNEAITRLLGYEYGEMIGRRSGSISWPTMTVSPICPTGRV